MSPEIYHRARLNIDHLQIRDLEKLDEKKPILDLLVLYVFIFGAVGFSAFLVNNISIYFYPIVIFLIAGRQGALLQLTHEAAHGLLSQNTKLNNFLGSWATSFLIGVNFEGYKLGHNLHHKHTSTSSEPKEDSEKYAVVNFKDPKIYFLFLKDLLGITALFIFFGYGSQSDDKSIKNHNSYKKIIFISKLSLIQLMILSLFHFNILNYILFWLYPAAGAHMFLMRIRGIAEHGLSKKLGKKINSPSEGLYYTRSFLTPVNNYKNKLFIFLEKILIGSFCVYFHHEHHLNSKIPYYNLKKFHQLVCPKVKENIENKIPSPIYEKGYFSAAFSTYYVPKEELM